MHRLGSGIHILIGLWILAGLTVVGINGYMLMSLLDEPLAGYSSEVRNADRGFRQYRILLTAEAEKITSGMDLLASRFKPIVVEEEKPVFQKVPATPPAAKKVVPPPVVMPTLKGIVTSRSTDGTARQLALMDGRICAKGDQLRDFTVKWITSGGVSLVRGDQTWFLKAPEIAYSLTTQ